MKNKLDYIQINEHFKEIIIYGKKLLIDPDCSIDTYSIAEKINNKTGNYKEGFNKILDEVFRKELDSGHINKKELYSLTKKEYIKIIETISSDKREIDIFNSIDTTTNIYEKFFITKNRYISEIFINTFNNSSNSITKMLNDFNKSFNSLIDIVLENYSNGISVAIKKIIDMYNDLSNFDFQYLEKWATYGWTVIEEVSIDFFCNDPISQKNADKNCIPYFTEKYISELFKKLSSNNNYYVYVIEAEKLFYSKCYMGCSMLLISSMDRILSETVIDKDKKQIGINAVKLIKEKFKLKKKKDILNMFVLYNLCVYLKKLFESGNNFINNINYINRNYLFHGWQNKSIEIGRNDCIKMLNALYNLQLNINDIKEVMEINS